MDKNSLNELDELDRGEVINDITLRKTVVKNASGMVVSGFLVEVERSSLDELMRDPKRSKNRVTRPLAFVFSN